MSLFHKEIKKKSVDEIEERLTGLLNEYFDYNGTICDLKYDPETGNATVVLNVVIVDEDDYVGFESY